MMSLQEGDVPLLKTWFQPFRALVPAHMLNPPGPSCPWTSLPVQVHLSHLSNDQKLLLIQCAHVIAYLFKFVCHGLVFKCRLHCTKKPH